MSKHHTIQTLEKQYMKKELPSFGVGDTVRIHTRIIEGDKERTQVVNGTVIAKKGSGLSETFCIYRHVFGVGMTRSFPIHSPRISKVEIVKYGDVRRAKLYHLIGASGKKAKVKSRFMNTKKKAAAPAAVESQSAAE